MRPDCEIVIPTLGRPSLAVVLDALAGAPYRIVVVDDRPGRSERLVAPGAEVVPGRAAGPAAARNVGWRSTSPSARWVAFVDDDVVPPAGWAEALAADLAAADAAGDVGATQGNIRVPRPDDRRPTDWERNVAGLEDANWATADMAYRRDVLEAVGGFDERFPRAYREDADLALRVQSAGWRLVRGDREILHPVRPADRWVSVRLQRGNADDALMRALHGRGWRERSGAPPGRKARHVAVTAAGAAAIGAAAARRPSTAFTPRRRALATAAGAAWLAGTAELAWARISPGPRTRHEVLTMVLTSAALPPTATAWSLAGLLRWRRRTARWPLAQ
ncbi:MAG: glycosyltransferase family 2 protein [Acidimicrobiia bacterium]